MKRVASTASPLPFPFVVDELMPLRPTIRRAFGFTYLYVGEILLCALRNSAKKPGSNGMWLFTTREHVDQLGAEFPELPKRYLWRSKDNAWVILPSKFEDFENYAFKACEMIISGDRRIGRLSRGKVSPTKGSYEI
jgi:hypothetical protein